MTFASPERRRTFRQWFIQTKQYDPAMLIAEPLAYLFRVAVALGPFVLVLVWDHPPFIAGLMAVIWGLGAAVRLITEGFMARTLAGAGRSDASGILKTHSWVLVARSFLVTAWLVPLVGLWSSAFETYFQGSQQENSLQYSFLALWFVADSVPFLDVPLALGKEMPPIPGWGWSTGASLLVLGTLFVYSIVLVVAELVTRQR